MGSIRTVAAVAVIALAPLLPLTSEAQQTDKSFKDWTVYTTTLRGDKTCYAATFPKKQHGNYKKRDEPYFIVTRLGNNAYEVSTYSGYPYRQGSNVTLDVEGSKYSLFTKGERAWATSEKIDSDIVAKMKMKSEMTAQGTSQLGTYSKDTYSLMGFSAALTRMNSICN